MVLPQQAAQGDAFVSGRPRLSMAGKEKSVRERSEDIRSNRRVSPSQFEFPDPVQEREWIALLDLQRKLEAMTCECEDQKPEEIFPPQLS